MAKKLKLYSEAELIKLFNLKRLVGGSPKIREILLVQ